MTRSEAILKSQSIWGWLGSAQESNGFYLVGPLEGLDVLTDRYDNDVAAYNLLFVKGEGTSYEAAFEDYYNDIKEKKQ